MPHLAMLICLQKCKQLCNIVCIRPFSGWVYQNDETYCNQTIELRLKSLSGGSVDLKTDNSRGIAFITINNPSKKNAFTGKMMYELRDAVAKLTDWKEGKALIVHGAEHSFCSGADLSTVREFSQPKDGEEMCMYMQNTLTQMHRLPLISVAFVEGKAMGGGAELCTACDFRLMSEDAEIQFVHKSMGLIPGWGGVTRLVQLVGRRKALTLLASAQKIESHKAEQIGLADHVILLSQKDLFHEIHVRAHPEEEHQHDCFTPNCSVRNAVKWLEDMFNISNSNAIVLQAIKKCVACCNESSSVEASLKREKDIFRSLWGAEANLAALAKSRHGKK